MEPRFSRAPVLNSNSFHVVCDAEISIAWPVTQFYEEVTSPMSGLEPLLYANITDVTCYHRRGPVTHDYLIMCIRPRESQEQFGARIWARCERHPGAVQGGLLKLFTVGTLPALDTFKFSFERAKLKHPSDTVIMESAFDSLQVLHVADLLKTIHSISPTYGVASHNCWWFAVVAIGTLQVFGKDWTIAPSRDWVKSAVKVLGRNTAEASDEVTRRFVQAWNIGAEAEFAPLTSDQAWTNHDSQHQVPILNEQLHHYVQLPRASTVPVPIAAPRSNQVSEPSPGHMEALVSQHWRTATIVSPPSGTGRTNVISSPEALQSSPESRIPLPGSDLGTFDMGVDGEKRLNGSSLSRAVLLDPLPEALSGVTLKSSFPVARGSYSVTLKGSWKSRHVALKLLYATDTPEMTHKRFRGEIEIWRKLRHRNVLPFFGHYVDDNGAMYMVSPWCQYGDINNYLRMFPKTNREMLILQVLHGLESLHKSGVIHGDLRGSNILMLGGEVRIADFGLSKYLDQSPTSTVNRGNIRWMAPELFDQELARGDLTPYNEATDIYSFAMTTIEIYTGSLPFQHLPRDVNVATALSKGERPRRPSAEDVSHGIDDYLWDIIQECWAQEPSRRPSASDVKDRLEAHRGGRLFVAL